MDVANVTRMFDANASRYDSVNSLLTFGLDTGWRQWAAREAVARPGCLVLDAFTGTGGLALACARQGAQVVATDISERMLGVTLSRAAEEHAQVTVRRCDLSLGAPPWDEATFDGLTIGFGLRYVDDPVIVLRSLRQTLAPGGRVVVLEVVRPTRGPLSAAAEAYFFNVMPKIASTITHQKDVYDALTSSVKKLGAADEVAGIVKAAGLRIINLRTFGMGLVTGIVAVTPPRLVTSDFKPRPRRERAEEVLRT